MANPRDSGFFSVRIIILGSRDFYPWDSGFLSVSGFLSAGFGIFFILGIFFDSRDFYLRDSRFFLISGKFLIIKVASFKIWNSDSVGVNLLREVQAAVGLE